MTDAASRRPAPGGAAHQEVPAAAGSGARLVGPVSDLGTQGEALRASEARYRVLVELSPDAVLVIRDERVEFVNPAGMRLFGATGPEQILGRSIFALSHPDHHRIIGERIRTLHAGGTVPLLEEKVRRLDGTVRDVEVAAGAFGDEHGTAIQAVLRDITDRKRLERALRESERLYRAIGESIDYGVWVCDPDGRNTYASESFLKMVGLTQEQCSDFGWGEALHPDDVERTIAAWKACVRTGGTWDMEHRFRGADGRWHDVLARGVPVRDEHGGVLCWAGINLDIGRLKRAEQDVARLNRELQRRIAELQAVLDTAPIGLAITEDPLGAHIRGNPAHERMLGLPAGAELSLGAPEPPLFRALQNGRELAVEELPMQRAVRGHAVTGQVLDLVWPGGRAITVYSSAAPLFDEDGRPRGAVGAFLEITDLKRAEQALRDSEERFRLFMDNSPAISWVKDEQGRYVYFSRTYERCFGVPPGGWLGKTDAELWPAEVAEQFSRNDRAVLARGEPMEVTEETLNADGSRSTWWNFKFPFRDSSGQRYVAGIGADITARRQAENALREASRRKDEFLAMLAHELRNPLVPIRNAAHVIGLLDPSEPPLRWARQTIERQVAHLTRLVDDLLDLSRIVRGTIALRREEVQLAACAHQAIETARPIIEAKGQRLELRLPARPVTLEGDGVRLCQVLHNLLDNATKYTPEGGRIGLEAEVADASVTIRVEDNGMGIPAELLPLVFDLFEQGERTLDRTQGGLGVGLTLVRRIVEAHGGSVRASSAGAGLGSTFTVTLPVKPAVQPVSPPEVAASARATGGARVLVVDDDRAVAESTAMLLQLQGYEVRVAHSGAEALDQARAFRPQVALLDIGLHGMDGYETARRLRDLPGGDAVRLVAVTGYGDASARARSQEAGFDHHLIKPVDPEELMRLAAPAVAAECP